MINVGFIMPSSDYLYDPFRGDPHTQLYILTRIESHFGKKVNPLLIDLRGIKKEFAIKHIPECDIYLYSDYTLDHKEEEKIVKDIREIYPKSKHIAGGPHVYMFQNESLDIFDSIVIGEGEELIVNAINDFQNLRLQKIYEQKSKIDVNNYPFELRKYLPKSATARTNMLTLKNNNYKDILGTTALFSRGCPYKCAFCSMPETKKFDKTTRYRKPEKIKEEIEYLKNNYQIEGLNILDEIGIPLQREKAISHLEAIASTGIIWRGQIRADFLTPEIAKLARDSGCVAMGIGAESASQQALDIINKKIKVEETKKTIRLLKDNNIEARIYMILGIPGEPPDIVERNWNFIEETQPDVVYLSFFTVRPGTEVYNNPKKFGIKKIDADWEKSMHIYGRYKDETPMLTFEYEKNTIWGRSFTKKELINNYMELQRRLRDKNISSV